MIIEYIELKDIFDNKKMIIYKNTVFNIEILYIKDISRTCQ
jgi:hypothetical protein